MLKIKKHIPHIFFFAWFLVFLVLGLLRDSLVDENIYIGEAVTISTLLKDGMWIGDYGVGLHGFLSKLLVGIIYIFTGPSVFVATLVNILFGLFSGVIFFKILRKNFNLRLIYSLLGVTLLFCSYQFLMYVPTFYRDIGALFFVLLILESILSKRSEWLSGIYLLLLLDAKEHVFFSLLPALGIWILIKEWGSVKNIFLSGIKLLLPSVVFLVLMFTTSLVPLNIYNANILGLIEGGLSEMSEGFESKTATYNQDLQFNKGVAKTIPLLVGDTDLVKIVNLGLSYIGKIFYPRTFSFLSIPFLMLVPAVILSWNYLKKWLKEKRKALVFLSIFLLTYLVIYIVRASLGRYLLPVAPVIIIFILYFLKDIQREKKYLWILILTTVFSAVGIYFEYSYLWVKILATTFLLVPMWVMYFSKRFNKDIFKYILIIAISLFTAGTSLLGSYTHGQIGAYLMYGYNRECEKIVALVDEDERVWINDIGWDRLPFILRGEDVQSAEWKWSLREWVPKKRMLRQSGSLKTFNFSSRNLDEFENKLLSNDVEKVVFVDLKKKYSNEKFREADIQDILEIEILKLEQKIEMKNKDVYIFEVVK
ncbi:MAG TPA: hypothetical protein PLA45_03055 [Candidatus Dojkabacteria bacterium]|nr:hypothetical protein [Candidatus Dojkabacteria bacterium]